MIDLHDGYTAWLTALCMLVLSTFGWRRELFGEHADIRPVRGEREAWTSMLLASAALTGWFAALYAARGIGLLPLTGIPFEQELGAALLTACVLAQPIRQWLVLSLGLLASEAAGRWIMLDRAAVRDAADLLSTWLLSFLFARGFTLLFHYLAPIGKRARARNK